ncbi:MAG: hypothetical protein JWM68_2246, partial [Verrucomicrobiales bacterium]|nr:hypothetical protein [Verrucomicrobiales bacterium]
ASISNQVPPVGTNLFGADQRVIQVTNAILRFTDGNLPGQQEQSIQLRTNNTVGIWGYLPVITSTTNFSTNLVAPFTVTKTIVKATNQVLQLTTLTASTNSELRKLTMAVDGKTGKISGSFTNAISVLPTGLAKTILWSGAVLQPWNVGYGYFLGTNQSGAVLLYGATNNVPPQ